MFIFVEIFDVRYTHLLKGCLNMSYLKTLLNSAQVINYHNRSCQHLILYCLLGWEEEVCSTRCMQGVVDQYRVSNTTLVKKIN